MGNSNSQNKNIPQESQQQQQQQQQPILQVNQPSSVNSIFSSNKRVSVSKKHYDQSVYDDDEPIEINKGELQHQQVQEEQKEAVKDEMPQKPFDLQNNFDFYLKSMTNTLKLNSKSSQFIPTMVSLDVKQDKNEKSSLKGRPPVDIICVIDKSGSMSGNKIQQVKETLNYLLELLNENDRIMLVQFASNAQRILPLKRTSKENNQEIKNAISSLAAGGGTDITSGLQLALKGIKERKFSNPVTSVFLLSDGQDGRRSVDYLNESGNIEGHPFTIHSFGFGGDHDPVLMNDICKIKDGNFYYVEHIETVDEMFIDALGGLFSVVAQDIKVTVKAKKNENKAFSDISVSKTYGDMWKYDNKSNEYYFNIIQFIKGVSKEYLLELEIPPIQHKLQDFERNTVFLEAEIMMYSNEDKERKNPIIKKAELQLTLYNEDEEIPVEVQVVNENVELNYLRVRGADMIQKCMKEADQGNYDKGKQMLQDFEQEISRSKPENQQKLRMLYEDIQESKETCTQSRYKGEGRFKMMSNNKAHMEKKSKNRRVATNQKTSSGHVIYEQCEDLYQNSVQQEMINERCKQKYC